jgi:hypothetical protein
MEIMKKRFSSARLKTYKVTPPSSPIGRMINIKIVLLVTFGLFLGIFGKAFWATRLTYCDLGKDD